ncbi:MAG: hypothetical protein K2X03_15860 [Bryobacteraceae bacterium]|nr:hypothetical protein [Bryobacteraceae bacterium]
MAHRPNPTSFEVTCPCCQATLKIDPELQAVIHHQPLAKPASPMEDLAEAVQKLKGAAARREDAFQKSLSDVKNRESLLNRKFDELLKSAQADPDTGPPKRDLDWD